MGQRRKARELAIQVLFHLEFNPDQPSESFGLICENFEASKSIRGFSSRLVFGVHEKRKDLDGWIQRASENWRLERMSLLDRSILRLATYEMLFLHDVPPKVSIDEAVELGKKFGSRDSAGFLNGVLDRIYSTLLHEGRVKERSISETQK
jgi:transcription antitermination factor NusB